MTSILIYNGILVTMKKVDDILFNAYVYIEDDKIVDYGKYEDMPEEYKMAELVINAKGRIIIPALTAAYVNIDFYPIRFKCFSKNPHEWYEEVELKYLNRYKHEYSEYALKLVLYNLINQGVASVCGSIRSLQFDLSKLRKTGLNIILAKTLSKNNVENEIKEISNINEDVKKETEDRIKLAIALAQTLLLDDYVVNALSESLGNKPLEIGLILEVAKVKEEISQYKQKYQKRPVEYLDSKGLLTQNTMLTHCTWVTLREIKLLAKSNSSIILCPESSLSLNEGIPPVMDIVNSKVKYTLGLDKGPSYNVFNLIRETLTIHNVLYGSSRSLDAYELLKSITIAPKTILNVGNRGIIEKGYKADIAIFRADPKEALVYSSTNIYELLVYGMLSLETLIANGEIIVDGGQQLVFTDEEIEKSSEELSQLIEEV